LLESSFDAFVLGLGIINNPAVTYRLESFVVLLCNAWELLMKAKMMALTYDIDPQRMSIEHYKKSKKLPKETIKWIQKFQKGIETSKEELLNDRTNQFFIPINLNLAIVRNPKKADIILSSGKEADQKALIIKTPKVPDITHPNRQKGVIEKVNNELKGRVKFNQYDCRVIRKLYNVDNKQKWFYQSRIPGRSPQYSDEFVRWLIKRAQEDNNFFIKARERYKEQGNA